MRDASRNSYNVVPELPIVKADQSLKSTPTLKMPLAALPGANLLKRLINRQFDSNPN